jgi:hypothetical protein
MSGTVSQLCAITDADRQWFANHPRRRHRTRRSSIDEVLAMPPLGPVPGQPYSAVLRRVSSGGFQKLIVPEVIIADLSERCAAAVWKFWFDLAPEGWRKDFEARA